MKDRLRSGHGITTPPRSGAHRFVYVLLILLSFAMLLVGKAGPGTMDAIRTQIVDFVTPALNALAAPVTTVRDLAAQVTELSAIREENQRLRLENERLRHWQSTAHTLEIENQSLRSLSNFKTPEALGFVTARIIADAGGAFVHSFMINAGTRDGVRKGQAVVTNDGLIGRIAATGKRSAQILLLTDINSRIPVLIESTRTRAVLSGNNADRARLIHLPLGASVSTGDRVVTSGHAGVFPPGLPVGMVTAVDENTIEVRPFVTRERMEYVRVVNYGLRGILGAQPTTGKE